MRDKITSLLKLLPLLSLVVILAFAAVTLVSAQESPEEMAKRYGITFPIKELGGCQDYQECRNYCEDPLHYETCINFAKEKGFYQEEKYQPDQAILQKAKEILGCDSYESCRHLCEKEENFDKCHEFAQSVGVTGGYRHDPRKEEILSKAKDILGCDSYESCKNFCENQANRDKCAEFAKSVGLSGGYEVRGPGGCISEETCRIFCTNPNNFEMCKQYSSSYGGRFSGPGGCSDEVSCRAFCEKNPKECGYQGEIRDYNPEEMCKKTPSCRWEGNTCQCSGSGGYTPSTGTPYSTTESQPASTQDPAAACTATPGCSWSNESGCSCSPVQGAKTVGNWLQNFWRYFTELLRK